MILKVWKYSYHFSNSSAFIANNIASTCYSNNENEFNAISDNIFSEENPELKTKLKLQQAEIQTLLSKLSI